MKNYSDWHKIKSRIENYAKDVLFRDREIWWCSLGANIGFEQDGKNDCYERPILVLRKFNNGIFWGLPMTSREKDNRFHFKVVLHSTRNGQSEAKTSHIILSQLRLLSSKRLIRRIGRINENVFLKIEKNVADLLIQKKRTPFGSPRVPNGNL